MVERKRWMFGWVGWGVVWLVRREIGRFCGRIGRFRGRVSRVMGRIDWKIVRWGVCWVRERVRVIFV